MGLLGSDVPPPPSTADYVAGLLRRLLVNGALEPGSRIKEAQIAEELGLSRGPVREAFRVLAEDGLIELLPNRGAVVTRYRAADVLEVYTLRARLGSLAIHKLIHDGTPDLRGRLQPAIDELEAAARAGDEPRVVEADLEFQDQLVRASELEYTSQIFRRLSLRLRMFVAVLGTRYDDYLDSILAENRELFELVVAGDLSPATEAWQTKLDRWLQHFLARLPDDEFDPDLWRLLGRG